MAKATQLRKRFKALQFIDSLMEEGYYFMLDYDLIDECELDEATQERINEYRELDKQYNWNLHYLTQMLVCKNFPDIVGQQQYENAMKTLESIYQ